MDRRGFLAAGAGSLGAVGCLGRDEQLARLAWIDIRNDRAEPYDVEVVVEDGGETVFSESYHLGTEPGDAAILEEGPVEGEGRYVVRGRSGTNTVKSTPWMSSTVRKPASA